MTTQEAKAVAIERREQLKQTVEQIAGRIEQVKEPADRVHDFMRDHPWVVLGGSALAGLLLGRRRRPRPILLLPSGEAMQAPSRPGMLVSILKTTSGILIKEAASRLLQRFQEADESARASRRR